MKDIIVHKDEYDTLASTGSVIVGMAPRKASKPNVTGATRKFTNGCGVSGGEQRRLRYEFAAPDGATRIKGGIVGTVVSVDLFGTDEWRVTFVKSAERVEDYMLARSPGSYTRDPQRSCDPEAGVPYTPEIERIIGSEKASATQQIKRSLMAVSEQAEALGDSPAERRAKLRIMQAIGAALSDIDVAA